MRETKIESYLRLRVSQAGGATRKFKSPGYPNVPDRLVIWPPARLEKPPMARVHFVECKAPGKKARPGQAREHVRLQKLGCVVLVLDTKPKIDNYVEVHKNGF